MSELITESVSAQAATDERDELDAQLKELYSLSADIIDLFHTQTFSPDTISTPADVCSAFANMILKRWDLCCIVIYLSDEDGHLRIANGQLPAILDLTILHGVPVCQNAIFRLGVIDNVNELFSEKCAQAHSVCSLKTITLN